ncbi:MAG: hypothetical protein FJY97_20310 [candidate division Zixibacteria bacterium]|nr:hypothetical protein [candidate division Zixibacteria bacterium]
MAEYEFTEEQNQTLARLSVRLKRFGVLFILLGAVRLVGNILTVIGVDPIDMAHIGAFLVTAITVVVGVLLCRPADSLGKIVASSGRDMTELMTGMRGLATAFGVIRLTLWLILVFVLIDAVKLWY